MPRKYHIYRLAAGEQNFFEGPARWYVVSKPGVRSRRSAQRHSCGRVVIENGDLRVEADKRGQARQLVLFARDGRLIARFDFNHAA